MGERVFDDRCPLTYVGFYACYIGGSGLLTLVDCFLCASYYRLQPLRCLTVCVVCVLIGSIEASIVVVLAFIRNFSCYSFYTWRSVILYCSMCRVSGGGERHIAADQQSKLRSDLPYGKPVILYQKHDKTCVEPAS